MKEGEGKKSEGVRGIMKAVEDRLRKEKESQIKEAASR